MMMMTMMTIMMTMTMLSCIALAKVQFHVGSTKPASPSTQPTSLMMIMTMMMRMTPMMRMMTTMMLAMMIMTMMMRMAVMIRMMSRMTRISFLSMRRRSWRKRMVMKKSIKYPDSFQQIPTKKRLSFFAFVCSSPDILNKVLDSQIQRTIKITVGIQIH